VSRVVFAVDDPRADDIRALLARHLAFAREHTPPSGVHALDLDGLLDPAVTFFSGRRAGSLVAMGALKELDETHGEMKSMHVVEAARGHGLGRRLVDRVVDVARGRGYRRISIETGTMEAFTPARSLYSAAGFVPCRPFGDYERSPTSAFLTRELR